MTTEAITPPASAYDRRHELAQALCAGAATQEVQESSRERQRDEQHGAAAGGAPAAVSRPKLEVADIFRSHGAAWRSANAGHVSLDRFKVMSAIERCRTAALGGHVERCEKCSHTIIAYNSCRNRHCPKCQSAAAREWLAEREAELLPVPYYHVVFTLPARIADIAYQNKAVIYDLLFKGFIRDHAHHRSRSEASRRSDWHLVRPPHLGLGDDPPPACAHDRARRRVFARRKALGLMSATLLPGGGGAVSLVPRFVHGQAPRRLSGR